MNIGMMLKGGLVGANALGNAFAKIMRPSQGYATQANWSGNGLANIGGGYIDLNKNKSDIMKRGQAMNESINSLFGKFGNNVDEDWENFKNKLVGNNSLTYTKDDMINNTFPGAISVNPDTGNYTFDQPRTQSNYGFNVQTIFDKPKWLR